MSRRDAPLWRSLALAACMIAVVRPADAHPHAWIDIEVEAQFDASARVHALRMTWLFDDIYSAYVTRGLMFDGSGKSDPARTARILQVIMENLARFRYMTRVEAGKNEVAFGEPADAAIAFRGRRLELTFTLPLASPAAAQTAPVTYSVYDPSYYIEMLHAETEGAIHLVNAPAECRYALIAPHPDPALVERAAALDRTQHAGDGLGKFFAERVEIHCAG